VPRALICTTVLIAVFALAAPTGFTQYQGSEINVVDGKVYADLPPVALSSLLGQLAEAAGIELSLSRDITLKTELHVNGASLSRVVDKLLPESYGYALELDQEQKVTRLIVFISDDSTGRPAPTNARQRYLARQIGRQGDDTADIMRETLADRSLDDSPAKLIAIEQLAEMDSEHARESLQAGMGDSDPQVRLATAKALYRLQGDAAITLIGQMYYAEDSASARKDVAGVVLHSPHPLAEGILRDSGLK
jgi:hypothetical protein